MGKFSKAGLLIVTLVIPALIFVFLKFFARNHYDLPYFNPEVDARGNVVIENGDTLFRKVNVVCSSVGHLDLQQKLTVISSLSGECDDDCKTFTTQLVRINNMTDEISMLQILTLADTLGNATTLPDGIGTDKWKLVQVPKKTIDNCLALSPVSVQSGNGYDKRWRLMLVDKQGYVRGYYNGKDASEMDRLMGEIKILDYRDKTGKE